MSNLHLKNPDYEEEPTDLEVGISVCDLRKVFKVRGVARRLFAVFYLSDWVSECA